MSAVERLIQEARTLPPEDLQRLIETLSHSAEPQPATSEPAIEARRRAVRQARGSMAGLLPSTEAFLAEKHAELELEERRYAEQEGVLRDS